MKFFLFSLLLLALNVWPCVAQQPLGPARVPGQWYPGMAVPAQAARPGVAPAVAPARPTAAWTTAASMATARGQHAAATVGGKLYAWNGYLGVSGTISAEYSSLEIYNPGTNTWSAGANYPVVGRGQAAAVGNDGLIYSFSGVSGGFTGNCYRYTPLTNAWAAIASLPTAVWLASAATAADGRIYVFGGYSSDGTLNSPITQIYNPTTNTWSTGASMPIGRHGHVTVKDASGLMHIIGGITGSSSSAITSHLAYNPTTNTWTTLASLPMGTNQAAGTLGGDGKIYVIGGKDGYVNNSGTMFNTVYVYDPTANIWSSDTNIPSTLSETKALTLGNELYVVAGASGGVMQSAVYRTTLSVTVPTVTTDAASLIATTSATLGGNVTNDGGGIITERGVVYITGSGTPTTSNTKVAIGTGTGAFSQNVTGLTAGTQYSVRAYAINSAGTSYGNVVTFTTTATATTWTGGVSTDWFTAGNWTAGAPTTSASATIPAGAPLYPVISTGTATTLNLTIDAGASLTQTGGTLDARGDLTNNGTFQPTGGTVVLGTVLQSNGPNILGSSAVRFWNLTVQSNGVLLTTPAATSVQRLLTLTGALVTQNNPFTLESNATNTALVVNNGTAGFIFGQATFQRYLAPDLNPGLGYRHFAAPTGNATVGSLATASFTPVVNPAYNTSATPSAETLFPTVYGYDQSRLASATNNLAPFDKGWFSPATTGDALTVGLGYTVNLAAGQTLSLTGPQNNAATQPITMSLSRNAGATAADAGWALVGNPFPSPLDYSLVAPADRANLDAAIYVFESTSQYAGSYRANVNGVGGNANSPNAILAQGQGFFVRVSSGQTSGTLNLRNAQRVAAYQNPGYHRPAETRPLVQLDLQSATGSDPVYVYFQNGATAGLDREFDAVKLPNSTGLNVSAETGTQRLAINALPLLGTATVIVPLTVGVPAAGSYAFNAAQLLNLGTTPVYLRDLLTGVVVDLHTQPSYPFTVSNAAALSTGRFELVFAPQGLLATAPAALAALVSLYPNPAHSAAFVELPAVPGRTAVTASLVDALGRPVRTWALPAQGAAAHQFPLAGLATGVYTLHLATAAGVLVKKLVVE